ncbi:putative membrane protein [Exiguobacterium sp. S17]|nr:putative membrane protein [Exiguobacterium sp. S17]
MIGHLLLGMLAPLCLALSAPMTLLLRTLDVHVARRVTRVLKSRPLQFFTNPVTASILNIGGLYLLYMTDLYSLMHQSILLYVLIHLHVFLVRVFVYHFFDLCGRHVTPIQLHIPITCIDCSIGRT